jgi:hypothetical protein
MNPIESSVTTSVSSLKTYQRGINDGFRSWSKCPAIKRRTPPRKGFKDESRRDWICLEATPQLTRTEHAEQARATHGLN